MNWYDISLTFINLSCTRNTRYLSSTKLGYQFSILNKSCTSCTQCTSCTRFLGSIRFDSYIIFIIIIIYFIIFIIFIIYLIYLFKNIYFQKSKNIYIPSTNVKAGKHELGPNLRACLPSPPPTWELGTTKFGEI